MMAQYPKQGIFRSLRERDDAKLDWNEWALEMLIGQTMRGILRENDVNLVFTLEDIDRWRKVGITACARLDSTGAH